ncbi:MAG TPA: DNA cytosine methyltransferase, partial [Pseudomonadales bacterium]|nr:DNA cytosine methyltransferase [Pseudomonadales bacterium]
GGKGFLLSDKSFTLSSTNFQTLFMNEVYPIDTRNALRNPEKQDAQNRQGVGLGDNGDPSPTLTDVFTPAVAFHQTQTPVTGDVSPALGTTSDGMGVMAFDTFNQTVSDKNQTIKAQAANNENIGTAFLGSTVRRLTPTECERLQGFPDGWTDGQADSHRYKQMGNAVAVPVVQWIVNRMVK